MKLKHLMTAAMGGLLLSCQGPAAVLADDPAAASPQAAITGHPGPRLANDVMHAGEAAAGV